LGERRDLDQVKFPFHREPLGILQRYDAEGLLSRVIEEANVGDTDLVVDLELSESDGWGPPETKNWTAR